MIFFLVSTVFIIMKHLKNLLLLLAILPMFYSCDEPQKDPYLIFIGDSIVARWDVQESFPSYNVYNRAKGGSGVMYIEENSGLCSDKWVVILTGTNDSALYRDEFREAYVERYLAAINGLDAEKIFLFSVLPRDFKTDNDGLNDEILKFNSEVEAIVADNPKVAYINVYDDFLDNDNLIEGYYSDGLHLTSAGYELLTTELLRKL